MTGKPRGSPLSSYAIDKTGVCAVATVGRTGCCPNASRPAMSARIPAAVSVRNVRRDVVLMARMLPLLQTCARACPVKESHRGPVDAMKTLSILLVGSAVLVASAQERSRPVGEFFDTFTAEWMRANPNLAASTRYFSSAEQDAFER